MMRVLVVTSLFPNPLRPNRAPFNLQQIAALAQEHDVQVIAPIAWTSGWGIKRSDRRRAVQNGLEAGERRIVRDGMVVHHPNYVFTPKVLRTLHGHCFEQSVRRTFQNVVREHRPDVVLGCWAYPDAWAAARLARECDLPVAIKVQGSDVLQVGLEGSRARRTSEALNMADAVIAVGRHVADRAVLLGVPRTKVHVVYNGIDKAVFYPGSKEAARRELGVVLDDVIVTYVGNLAPVKGVEVLIRAMSTLVRSGRSVRCVLVGDGPRRRPLERLVASLGLGHRVEFMGSCSLARVATWHRATDLLVLPSLSEGVPNVLREAQACGTPFVSTRVGGVPEIAPPGTMVPPGDASALARRLGEALDCRADASELRHGLVQVPPQSWQESARELASVLRGIVGRSANRESRSG